jgi:hypothetical protein
MEQARGRFMTGSDTITDAEFARLRGELAPDGADAWQHVPWQISLAQAVRVAARTERLLVMVVRSGHPLGCTCNNGVVDRAAITGNPEIAALLATRFVPVAIDQHVHRRLNGFEGRLFAELVRRATGQFLHDKTQGFYVFTCAGELLAFRHTLDPIVVKQMLISALERTESKSSAPGWIEAVDDSDLPLKAPPGVMVLDVVSKVLAGYAEPSDYRQRILQSSLGRDHFWIRDDEVGSLSEEFVPDSLLSRMARFHLVDNTRGEPPMWRADQVRRAEAVLRDGRLVGSVRIDTARARRGYEASLLGFVDVENGVLTQFDVVARGLAWGRGYHNRGAPRGKYSLAVRFTMSKGAWPFDAVPPGAARTQPSEYLGVPVGSGFGE